MLQPPLSFLLCSALVHLFFMESGALALWELIGSFSIMVWSSELLKIALEFLPFISKIFYLNVEDRFLCSKWNFLVATDRIASYVLKHRFFLYRFHFIFHPVWNTLTPKLTWRSKPASLISSTFSQWDFTHIGHTGVKNIAVKRRLH